MGFPAWLARGLEPLISLGAAFDAHHSTDYGTHDVDHLGAELGLANIVFARLGRSRSERSSEVTDTWGIGLGLPLGEFGGFRYEHAHLTPRPGFGVLKPNSWTVWMDPVAVARLRK